MISTLDPWIFTNRKSWKSENPPSKVSIFFDFIVRIFFTQFQTNKPTQPRLYARYRSLSKLRICDFLLILIIRFLKNPIGNLRKIKISRYRDTKIWTSVISIAILLGRSEGIWNVFVRFRVKSECVKSISWYLDFQISDSENLDFRNPWFSVGPKLVAFQSLC